MNNRAIAITAVLMAAALTGLFATSPLAYAGGDGGDESETSTDQEVKQKNTGSGNSNNNNCAENQIGVDAQNTEDCTSNNQPSSPPVDMTATETVTETDITTNPLFNLADLFDLSTTLPQ
jgi:hypothetical protein